MPRAATIVVAVTAAVGLVASVARGLDVPGTPPPRIDARYVAARDALRGVIAVGYLSDVSPWSEEGTRLYTDAAYALAPTLVRRDPGGLTLHVANLRDPAALDALAARSGLRVRQVLGPGLALLEGRPR